MQSAHPTVFSSGGDLKALHELDRAGRAADTSASSIARPTLMCWMLEKFIRPNVPLINGLVLGGGIGITLLWHALRRRRGLSLRPCRKSASASSPISAARISSRACWARFGLYLALTGRIIGPADAYRLRLVSHYIPAAHFDVIKDAISDNHPIDRLLDGLHRDPGEGELVRHTPVIHRIFSASPSVEEILRPSRCRARAPDAASRARPRRRCARSRRPLSKSPSPRCSAAALEPRDALKLEFRLASHLIGSHDYREGITARITGKGRAPHWSPATPRRRRRRGDRAAVFDRAPYATRAWP